MIEDLTACFDGLADPRVTCQCDHRLIDILVIAVSAVIACAETFGANDQPGRFSMKDNIRAGQPWQERLRTSGRAAGWSRPRGRRRRPWCDHLDGARLSWAAYYATRAPPSIGA